MDIEGKSGGRKIILIKEKYKIKDICLVGTVIMMQAAEIEDGYGYVCTTISQVMKMCTRD